MKRINFKLNNDDRIEIMELYREGNSAIKISEIMGVSPSNINNILAYYNVNKKYNRDYEISNEDIERIKSRIDNGELITNIAIERNVSVSAISHLIKRRS